MENSILKASENAKTLNKYFSGKNKIVSFLVLGLAAIGPFTYAFFVHDNGDSEDQSSVQEYTVKKSDLQISIASDGRVVNNDSISLVFPVSGTVNGVYVNDGQMVKRGDKIASLDTTELQFALNNALAGKQIASSNLLAKQSGASESDIALSEKNISLAEKHLADVRKQNEIDIKNAELALSDPNAESAVLKVDQAYDDAILRSAQALTEIENAINEADRVLGINDIAANDTIENVLGVKNSASVYDAISAFNTVMKAKNEYVLQYQGVKLDAAHNLITQKLASATQLAMLTSQMMGKTTVVLDNTITSNKFSQSNLDSYKDVIIAEHTKIKQEIETLANTKQAIATAELELSSKNSTLASVLENVKLKASVSESDAENQLEIARSLLQLKTEPARDVDVAALRAQITQAQNQVNEAEYRLRMATLIAPMDGKITNINFRKGDFVGEKNDVFAVISNKGNFSVETYIEEIDITKIQIGQKAYVTFDAVEGVKLEAAVTSISDVPTIDANGIVTYLVKLTIKDTENTSIREGMTSYVDFIIAEAKNVLVIPVAAVKRVENKPSVQLKSGEWKEVQTAFTDGNMVEITSGISAGDVVLYYE